MAKKFFTVFSMVILVAFFAASGFAQERHSLGPAPVSEQLLQSNYNTDNVMNANNRGFVYISGTSSHQLNKQFMGNVTVTAVGSPFTGAGWVGAIARNTSTGVLYVCNQASPFNIWSIDTTTGVCTQVIASCTGIPHANFTGMVWDHTTGTMYGISSDLATSQIFTINMTTGVCTPVGTSSSVCAGGIGIYCAPNGSLFADDIVGNNLYKINKTTGAFTLVGALGFDANYGQDGAFDLTDGVLYLASAGPGNILRTCDTVTGTATNVIGTYAGQPSCLIVVANPGPSVSHTPLPNTLNLAGPYVVNAVVTPSGSAISSSKIFWSRNNTTITDSVTMTNSSGNNWTGNIPGNGAAATYRYYIKALDGLGRAGYHPGGAPSAVNMFQALASDTVKPVITHTPLTDVPKANWPATVTASVTDNIGIDSVWVRWYKNNNSVVKQFKLLPTTGTNYAAAFNSLNSEVAINDSIFYRVIAQDNSSNHNRDSSAIYKFKITAIATVCLGTGTVQMGSASGPYNTYWYGNRTQILYTAAEIIAGGGAAGIITRMGFQIATVGGQAMTGLTFRVKTTTLTSISTYETTGWTTVYTGTYTVPGTGWQYVDFAPAYVWDGTSNLIFEICFGNTSYTTATVVNGTTMSGMEISEYHDLSTACAYTGFTTPVAQTARANTCFVINTGVGTGNHNYSMPTKYSLSQNYPNPFNPITKINFEVPKQGFVSLKIYDVLGREVKTLVSEIKAPGAYAVDFNASELSSGVYFYRMEANGFTDIKKMMLIK